MRRPAAGFTIVEVLVAVLLLAVGLVGALAMQAHAMRTRQETAMQTEALHAAAALADRIRANAAQSSAYLGFGFDADSPPPPPAGDACAGAPCDAATLAQRDLADFRRQLHAALPGGRAHICRDAPAPDGALQWGCVDGAGAPIVIKIGWRGRAPAGSAAHGAPRLALPVVLPAGAMP